jgi:hypothetical protein
MAACIALLVLAFFAGWLAQHHRVNTAPDRPIAQQMPTHPPSPEPQRTLVITHFVILYREVDAAAVYQLAARLEARYVKLRGDLGLSATSANTYTIEVATDQVQNLFSFNYLTRKMSVTSPTLLSGPTLLTGPKLLAAPVEIPAATLLEEATLYPLARFVLYEAIDQHGLRWKKNFYPWRTIVAGIPLWELWDEGGPLSTGHEEIIRWLYANGKNPGAAKALPDGYERLCRVYRIWQISPRDLYLPLACRPSDQHPAHFPALPATWLQPQSESESEFAIAVMNETLIEYIVATYGRDQLPALLTATGSYSDKVTLIHALFGISAADFEAGWQNYLEAHYR